MTLVDVEPKLKMAARIESERDGPCIGVDSTMGGMDKRRVMRLWTAEVSASS